MNASCFTVIIHINTNALLCFIFYQQIYFLCELFVLRVLCCYLVTYLYVTRMARDDRL